VVDERASESDASRSEVVRDLLQLGIEHDELQTELGRKDAKIRELRNQLQERGNVEEKVDTLVERTEGHDDALREAVESSRDAREWSRAGLVTRTKWRLFGRPSTNGDRRDDVEENADV